MHVCVNRMAVITDGHSIQGNCMYMRWDTCHVLETHVACLTLSVLFPHVNRERNIDFSRYWHNIGNVTKFLHVERCMTTICETWDIFGKFYKMLGVMLSRQSLWSPEKTLQFICCLFNDTVSSSNYIASNERVTNNDLERMRHSAAAVSRRAVLSADTRDDQIMSVVRQTKGETIK